MTNLSTGEIESRKPIGASEDLNNDLTSIGMKRSYHDLCSKKMDENESYFMDNSENEFAYSEHENLI